ncbi:MAG: AMP-dependent synthetase/ligase [Syntrophomonadales bacterium]|jgi:long-chain acyl-CoA synthetase
MQTRNLASMIHAQVEKYSDKKNALYYKEGNEWRGISWREFGNRIDNAAKGLLELGVKENEFVAIYSGNRPEWTICDYAIMSVKCSTVTIYATNISEQAEYIVDDAQIRVIFVDEQFQYDNVMKFFNKSKTLEYVIVFSKSVKIEKNKNVMYLDDLYELGKKSGKEELFQQRLKSLSSDDIAAIIYTSGTTGDPKGAMLAHESFFVEIDALEPAFPMKENDIELVFLPLSHVYEKASCHWIHSKGATQYFCHDTDKIVEYFQEIRPTYMVGVPRLYEKVYAAVYANIEKASSLKKKIFTWGIDIGKKYRFAEIQGDDIPLTLKLKHFIAFKLVLQNVRALLGGRLNFFSAGGAPLAKEIEEFFFAANIFIAQGYGLTETCPMGTYNCPNAFKFGTVGKPIPGNVIKIAPDGEILIKGNNVMKGYWNKPEATAEVMTEDGYFMTGDIGEYDQDGFLRITDRKKDIIITANGKNVAPQKIESRMGQDYYVEQIVVIGDKQKYLTALLVPSFPALEEYANEKGIKFETHEDLIKNPEIIKFYRERIDGQSHDLANFEKIQKFTLLANPLSIERNEITPTLKVKRRVIAENYKDIITEMYAG